MVLFRVRSCVARSKFHGFFMVRGSKNHSKIDQHRSEELLGHRVGRKSVPTAAREANGRAETKFGRISGTIWGAQGATTSCGGGSPGLQPDRRGGVGEG